MINQKKAAKEIKIYNRPYFEIALQYSVKKFTVLETLRFSYSKEIYLAKERETNEKCVLSYCEQDYNIGHHHLKHPCIMEFEKEKDVKTERPVYISKFGYRIDHEIPLPMSKSLYIQFFQDISSALRYLHSSGYIYGDLHPGNIVYLNGSFFLIDLESIEKINEQKKCIGTQIYSSIPFMCGERTLPIHGIESLLYCTVYCRTGSLPWIEETDPFKICQMKIENLRHLLELDLIDEEEKKGILESSQRVHVTKSMEMGIIPFWLTDMLRYSQKKAKMKTHQFRISNQKHHKPHFDHFLFVFEK